MFSIHLLPIVAAVALLAQPQPEATSLLGAPLHALAPGANPEAEAGLAAARRAHAEDPEDPDKLIWVGRRYGYLWRMNAAVSAFSRGIERFPDDPRFYRHRGHRLISLRRFAEAEQDLARAVELLDQKPELAHEIEPDGQPNQRNIPLTTTGFNVFYHLALAQYLQEDFAAAAESWAKCAEHTRDIPDNIAAVTYWRTLTLMRVGRGDEAGALLEAIDPEAEIIENHAYHRLVLLYKQGDEAVRRAIAELANAGEASVEDATFAAGLANWLIVHDDAAAAEPLLERIVAAGPWPAFGVIAAEAELARLRATPGR